MKTFQIDEAFAQEILTYLSGHPYKDVAAMIAKLVQLQPIEGPIQGPSKGE